MEFGKVKSWDRQRGFGFIVMDNEDELFVNINDLHVTLKQSGLREGQSVSFDIKSDMKGERAVNVRKR